MDHHAFDQLTRLLGQDSNRRTALGTLLGAGLFGASAVDAKRHGHKKRKRRRSHKSFRLRECPNPGPGRDLSRCNFAGQDLSGADLSGSNLSRAVFAYTNLCSANLRGANLTKTNFTWAVLTRADLRETDLSMAILGDTTICRTWMPNNEQDNSHCPHDDSDICCSTAECGAGVECERGWCGGPPPQAGACRALGDICTIGASPGCCGYSGTKKPICDSTWGILATTCQRECDYDGDCKRYLGFPDVFCAAGLNCFPGQKCCFRKRTRNPKECSSGNSCLISQTVYECCFPGETCSPIGYGCV